MKIYRILQFGITGIIFILSSCKVSHSHDGTYEGIIPAADCPGIYILLTIDGDKYELLEKYITHQETFITYGNIKKSQKDKICLDNNMELRPHENNLLYQNMPLKEISSQKKLPEICTSLLLKEYKSGEDATLRLYSKKDKRYADFYFKNKEYKLKLNPENKLAEEYSDSNNCLKISSENESASSEKISFNDKTETYTFALLSPTNCIYKPSEEKKTATTPSVLDVTYYNDDKQAFVKIINTTSEQCYTLIQTDASAKTAIYSDGKITWQLGNQQDAILIIENQKYKYEEL